MRWGSATALAVLAAGMAAAQENGNAPDSSKKTEVPFYRQYLVPGNTLDDQIAEQEKRVEASPDDANLRTDFGNLLAMRRFPEQAAEQYEMAAKLDKKNFIAPYNLGLLLETQGKDSSAISAYRKSISRKPGFPPSQFHLGLLLERQNDLDAAVEHYAKALRIDPSMRDPKRNPLVVQTELMYQASLVNYPRDLATNSMRSDAVFVEEARFRRVPVDRALSTQEVAADEEPEVATPREVGPGNAAGTGGAGATTAPPPATRRNPRASTFPQPPPEGVGPGTGTQRPTSTGRPPRATRPTPQVAPTPAPPPPPEEQPEVAPEPAPEPTPEPSSEVEPS
jgi:Tfp pilus assembly protein PilF